jgi:hypothetical protein
MKYSSTTSGSEPATFRLVARYLKKMQRIMGINLIFIQGDSGGKVNSFDVVLSVIMRNKLM